jgi:hypothetical protein
MEGKIHEINWAELEHAYGTAEELPELLENAFISKDEDSFKELMSYLWYNLYHQGTIYPSTAKVVPFLIEALDYCPESYISAILDFLATVSEGLTYFHQHYHFYKQDEREKESFQATLQEELAYSRECFENVWQGIDKYLSFLNYPDEEVRMVLPYMLYSLLGKDINIRPEAYRQRFLDQEIADQIFQQLYPNEPNSFVICSQVFCLQYMAYNYPEAINYLLAIHQNTLDNRVKICAAIALAAHQKYDVALPTLLQALEQLKKTDQLYNNELLWFVGWFRFQIVYSLCSFPYEYAPQMTTGFLQVIKAASAYTADTEIEPILTFVFGGKHLPTDAKQVQLSDNQKIIMQAIYNNGEILGSKIGNVGMALRRSIGIEDDLNWWKQALYDNK